MKKNIGLLFMLLIFSATSCKDDFIEKPAVTGLTVNDVFSSSKNAEGAIALAYSRILSSGLPALNWNAPFLPYEATEAIMGGEDVCNITWAYMHNLVSSGMTPESSYNSGAGLTDDYFPNNYSYIRQACLVAENIDMVPDMSDNEKNIVKGEMKGLVAFRHLEMLKRYGGVPLVDKVLRTDDVIGRSSVQETLDFIIRLCDEAAEALNGVTWSNDWYGRLNKGVVLAIKAEALIYAARPLFNSDAPYLPFGENNPLICLGNKDNNRWQKAVDANLEVISWGEANGYKLIDTDNPFVDYATAVGTPCNMEVLLAYKQQGLGETKSGGGIYKNYCPNPYAIYDQGLGGTACATFRGMSYEMLLNFRKADGSDQTWAGETPRPYTEYYNKVNEMEPRFKASVFAYGVDPWNNRGNEKWSVLTGRYILKNSDKQGVGRNVKFWYNAGNREWFEFPIYRMAEFYLNIAEAYNELSQPEKALEYLNIIRDRAGLPLETEKNQSNLRQLIQREWAVEFYAENQHYPHARHWKLGSTMIGGNKNLFNFNFVAGVTGSARVPSQFDSYNLAPAVIPVYMWHDRMYLTPITQSEVNKRYLVQNPGY